MIKIRRASWADAQSLAPRLRQADKAECRAALGLDPEAVLPFMVARAEHVWAAVDQNDEVQALFGLDPVDHQPLGVVWMVTSDAILKREHIRDLISLAPMWLAYLNKLRPLIGNFVDARNTVHIRWLKRLGFSFLREIPDHGVERRPFYQFARLR